MIRTSLRNEPDSTSGRITKILNTKGFTNRNNKNFHISTVESIIRYNNIPYKFFKETTNTVKKEDDIENDPILEKNNLEKDIFMEELIELVNKHEDMKLFRKEYMMLLQRKKLDQNITKPITKFIINTTSMDDVLNYVLENCL